MSSSIIRFYPNQKTSVYSQVPASSFCYFRHFFQWRFIVAKVYWSIVNNALFWTEAAENDIWDLATKGRCWVWSTKYVYIHTYIKSTTVYVPSSEFGLSQPLSRQRVCLSPQNRGGEGAHSPSGEGLGESQFRRLEKRLSTLPTLWFGA